MVFRVLVMAEKVCLIPGHSLPSFPALHPHCTFQGTPRSFLETSSQILKLVLWPLQLLLKLDNFKTAP